jgi:hypothetical protein
MVQVSGHEARSPNDSERDPRLAVRKIPLRDGDTAQTLHPGATQKSIDAADDHRRHEIEFLRPHRGRAGDRHNSTALRARARLACDDVADRSAPDALDLGQQGLRFPIGAGTIERERDRPGGAAKSRHNDPVDARHPAVDTVGFMPQARRAVRALRRSQAARSSVPVPRERDRDRSW